ncbi:MAG: translational GTPase TypA [Victivallaceae bacterium]|nr:translational GTPase TypA [Victivallaceae bacterium]NLK83553.1 translational GTPase TypA [Lentisphaerota bacterium]MDD3116107.1 translational GTPase TypA [Victivallaceae bacterium]MDD3703182.1 translational GTPase TypA [Victivallaceae bacterium]MDD4318271.1 translational GTPase TypA [Victivallaceae bacterium]
MKQIRNIAIIAHVDHGKTTLVDKIIMQAKMFRDNQEMQECFLDSNDLERERGITILSKNISIEYQGIKINVIDTPGHSDFGGQVERVLNLADGVILLVDSAEGPMPQTRFVLDKALRMKLKPIVLVNKVDKPDARPQVVLNKVFDLFCELNADDDQLDFPVLFASGRDGWAVTDLDNEPRTSIMPLMDAVIQHIPAPPKLDGPVQMQITTLDYSDYVGRIGIGRVHRGVMALNRPMVIIKRDGTKKPVNIKQIFTFEGLKRSEVNSVPCGDLCAIVGVEGIDIGDTITDAECPEALPPISVDEPTLSMIFRVNDSPFYGREGKYVSSRHLRERLLKEAEKDVALRVADGEGGGESFKVSGRGVLHLSILIETMRREGYEMAVAPPQVICKEIDGQRHEPMEMLSVDVPDEYTGKIIELAGQRQGEMCNMEARGKRQLVEFKIPTRGLIGFRSRALTLSAGEAIVAHRYIGYEPMCGAIPRRTAGSIVSAGQGKAMAYALDALQQRGFFFIEANDDCYEGMIVGEHCKEGDITVNIQRGKQLTNMRASGSDHNMKIAPARKLSLEQALEYIEEDELVEITPQNMRLRKLYLTELERKRNKSSKAMNQ